MIKIGSTIVDTKATFPDGALALKSPVPNSATFTHVYWNYENDAELFALICLRKKYAEYDLILHMPYIPHARMDRVKNPEDVFTLKYFCEVINSLNFHKVCVLDAHSNVALALLDRVVQMPLETHINSAIKEHCNEYKDVAIFYPDEGAVKRYSDFNPKIPFAFGMKQRDWTTGKILGLTILQAENIVDKDVLIIDDICSKGGTFYHSAKALKEAGARSVSVYVTHCENTILQGEIFTSGLIDKVYTTDSLVHCDELKDKIIYV